MAYTKTTWKDRVVEKPRTFALQNNADGTITLAPAEGQILEPGTPIIAANLNNIEEGIASAHSSLAEKASKSDLTDVNNDLLDKTNKFMYNETLTFPQRKDIIFGTEYLAPFQLKVARGLTTKTTFSGDSTTAGYALVDSANWRIDNAFLRMAKHYGLQGITVENRGQSGMCTEHWNQTYVDQEIAANPDLLVLRWGINDPAYDKNLNHLADDGQNYSIRRNAQDFKASLESGLSKIRAVKGADVLPIVLMTPNSTSDDTSFRNEAWHESINSIIRDAARTFNCCFIDTYRLWQDSRNTTIMDTINNGHIHPLDFMNLLITDVIFNTVFPRLFVKEYSIFNKVKIATLQNGYVNLGSGYTNASYYMDNNKNVHLEGVIKGTALGVVFLLDLPFRPAVKHRFDITASNANNEKNTCEVDINTNGEVRIIGGNAGGYISLSGISFRAQ